MTRYPSIIIIGAGPAGAAAAIKLAQLGHRSTIIDKSVFPRDKVCGDALSLDVINQLEWISPSLSKSFFNETPACPSKGVSIISPGNHRVDIPFVHKGEQKAGYVSRRIDFDHCLLQEAKRYPEITLHLGEQITHIERRGQKINLKTNSRQFSADLVLGADGAQSIVARKLAQLKLEPAHHSAGIRQYYDNVSGFHPYGYIELYFFRRILPGYLWVFPLPNKRANVGIGMLSKEVARKGVDLKKTMEEILKESPTLKERFEKARALEAPKGFGLPLGSRKRNISGDAYLLLGDAGGLIDPFSGEGIANALRSGRVAAEYIDNAIKNEEGFEAENNRKYDEEIWKRVWPELQLSSRLQKMCRYPFIFDLITRKAERNPVVHQFLVDALAEVSVKKQLTKPSFYWNLIFS